MEWYWILAIIVCVIVALIVLSAMFYKQFFKRFYDVTLSGIALIILSPLLLIVSILVKANLGSPIFFRQERPGKKGKMFCLIKFRTMSNQRDENGQLLPDEMRTNKYGRFLRSTSLDELPECFNVLVGDMSIIGPRPLLPRDVACMNEEQFQRHNVRPGLTGLAQCNGRNALNWDEKLALDIEYVNNISFFSDILIFVKTIGMVVKRKNVNFVDGADMDLKEWNERKTLEKK